MNLQQRYFFIFFLTAFNISHLKAQKIGDWTSYLPYQSGITVAQSESKIYYGTEWSIVQIDKEDFSSKRISKVDGLSDIGVKEIEFDDTNDQLIIAYTNGNIDFLKDQEVINLPNIKLNTDLIGTKSVNNINVSGDMIYLSTGFGLVTISSNDLLFGSTTFTDIPVQESVIFEDQILYLLMKVFFLRLQMVQKTLLIFHYGTILMKVLDCLFCTAHQEYQYMKINYILLRMTNYSDGTMEG